MTHSGDPAETLVQRYLGPEPTDDPREEEPSAALLSAFVAGELPPGEVRDGVARYLEAHPKLRDAIRSALEVEDAEDAEDAKHAEALTAPHVLTLADLGAAPQVTPLDLRAPTMALAAAEDEAPIPMDRQRLLRDEGVSLVYFRRLTEGWILLSGDALRAGLVRLRACAVGARSCPVTHEAEGQVANLGPLGPLSGERLTLTIETPQGEFVASWDLRVNAHEGNVASTESPR